MSDQPNNFELERELEVEDTTNFTHIQLNDCDIDNRDSSETWITLPGSEAQILEIDPWALIENALENCNVPTHRIHDLQARYVRLCEEFSPTIPDDTDLDADVDLDVDAYFKDEQGDIRDEQITKPSPDNEYKYDYD